MPIKPQLRRVFIRAGLFPIFCSFRSRVSNEILARNFSRKTARLYRRTPNQKYLSIVGSDFFCPLFRFWTLISSLQLETKEMSDKPCAIEIIHCLHRNKMKLFRWLSEQLWQQNGMRQVLKLSKRRSYLSSDTREKIIKIKTVEDIQPVRSKDSSQVYGVAKRQAVRFVFRNDWAIYWTQPLIRIEYRGQMDEMVFTPFSSPRTNESWFTFLSISPSSKGNKVKCIAFYGGSKSQLLIFYDRCMPSRQYLFVASMLKHMNRIHMSSESDISCEIINDSGLQAVPTVH